MKLKFSLYKHIAWDKETQYCIADMYRYRKIQISEGKAYKYILYRQKNVLSFGDFLKLLAGDPTFRSFFIKTLTDLPLEVYHWETPPISESSIDQSFEFVVTHSPGIDLRPDPGPFHQYFSKANEKQVAVFNNLGNDAKLIAPQPIRQDLNYAHIGAFTEVAPEKQQQSLWQRVGEVTQNRLSDQPLWLNTAGGGVAWLHVRLDSSPKYYMHRSYKTID